MCSMSYINGLFHLLSLIFVSLLDMAKNLGRLLVYGITIVSRAFTQALKFESSSIQFARRNAEDNGRDPDYTVASNSLTGITLEEAKQILHIKSFNPCEVQRSYEYLFTINDKNTGGSFYIQSKIFRAKQRIDFEMLKK